MGKKRKHRVLLVDDHPVVREGIGAFINRDPGFSVCAAVGSIGEAQRLVREYRPDLAVIDLKLGEESGVDLIGHLKIIDPKLRMVAFTMHDEEIYAERVIKAGACGYVMKDTSPKTLLQALKTVLDGGTFLSDRAARSMFVQSRNGGLRSEAEDELELLSKRELVVFRMIGQGESSADIAQKLGLKVKTIDSHRANIKRKLRLRRATCLIRRAARWVDSETNVDPL